MDYCVHQAETECKQLNADLVEYKNAEGYFKVKFNRNGYGPSFPDRNQIGNYYFIHIVIDPEETLVGYQAWPITVYDPCVEDNVDIEELVAVDSGDYVITQDTLATVQPYLVRKLTMKFT